MGGTTTTTTTTTTVAAAATADSNSSRRRSSSHSRSRHPRPHHTHCPRRCFASSATAVVVERGDPLSAEPLLLASHALMESLFPPEDNHFLSLDALRAPDIRFFVARGDGTGSSGDRILGCGALAVREGYGELKSMFTDEAARGRGVASSILQTLEGEARALRLPWLRLETGDRLHAALAFYRGAGFAMRGPFGGYEANETSRFMEKRLPSKLGCETAQ